MSAGVRVAFACVGSMACSANVPDGPPPLPETIVLRIDRVVVAPTRPETAASWDQTLADTPSGFCDFVGAAMGAATSSPVAASGAELLCNASQTRSSSERGAGDPDLALRISAGTGTPYLSRVVQNVTEETFKYELAVPTEAIPPDGLLVEVVDDDAAAGLQVMGAFRLTRAEVARTLAGPTHLSVQSDPAIRRLELVITDYAPAKLSRTSMDANEGLHTSPTRALFAGEVVALKAEGHYTVGTWYDHPINPFGYPAEKARSYNFGLEPFHSAPHACGIAMIGGEGKVHGVVVRPARTFVAQVPGPLRFGVNDKEPSNNRGSLEFEGGTRAATVDEWMSQRVAAN
jgi:hypothetical protein